MNVVICDAIRTRRLLRFVYGGYERIVEPHAYGVNTAGHEALSAWLVSGWSRTEREPGWRTYLVEEMGSVAAMADGFAGARSGYNPEDPRLVELYCQLATDGA